MTLMAIAQVVLQLTVWESLAFSSELEWETTFISLRHESLHFASSESASWYIVPECPEPRQTAMKKAFDISSALAKWRW